MAQSGVAALSGSAGELIAGALLLIAALIVVVVLAVRLALRLRAARQGAVRLQQLIDSVADRALLLLDAAGRVIGWSAGAERLYGYGAAQMVGQPHARLYTPEDCAERVPQDTLESAARVGNHGHSGWRLRQDGSLFFAESRIRALRDAAGRLVGFSSVEQDVSERLQQQQALAQARSALAQAQKMAALGRLSDGIAHDFNNVVQVISTCVEVLQRQSAGQPQPGEFLQMIKRNADRAAGLSQHLLALSRRQPPHPAPTDVNSVVGAVVELLRQTLSEDIVVELKIVEGLGWVLVDRNELEAALLNLAANARDAMSAGGRLSFATAEALGAPGSGGESRQGHYVLISISDTGGADSATRTPVDPGLDLVRSLVEQSRGGLQMEREARGTTVRLYLPCRAG